MAKNTMADLRDHLFETLEALKDPDKPMEVERARAVSEVAQTLINSAKVEIDMLKVVGGTAPHSEIFFGHVPESRDLPKKAITARRDNGVAWPGTLSGTK